MIMSENGKHGNSTHGIRACDARLRKGERFDGFMLDMYLSGLARRGLTEDELEALGGRGDIIRHTARLSVAADLVWSGLLMAGSVGDVRSFYGLLRDHGHRFGQALKWLYQEQKLKDEMTDIYDYEELVAQARGEM